MSKHPFMPLFVDAYLADTTHLTAEESGAYLHILMVMWRHDGVIYNDDADLMRMSRAAPARWSRVKARIMPFLTVLEDGRLTQKRLAKEWNYVSGQREANSKNGKSGGYPTHKKNKELAVPNGTRSVYRNRTPHTYTYTHTSNKKDSPSPKSDVKEVRIAFDAYNETASHLGLPIAQRLTESRAKQLGARLKIGGLPEWRRALENLDLPFLRGEGPRGWRANLDFLIQPTGFQKVLEKAFESGAGPRPQLSRTQHAINNLRAAQNGNRFGRREICDGGSQLSTLVIPPTSSGPGGLREPVGRPLLRKIEGGSADDGESG